MFRFIFLFTSFFVITGFSNSSYKEEYDTLLELRDVDAAYKLALHEANSGNSDAQIDLGWLYQNSFSGRLNYIKAAYWYDQAITRDNPNGLFAMHRLLKRFKTITYERNFRCSAPFDNNLFMPNISDCDNKSKSLYEEWQSYVRKYSNVDLLHQATTKYSSGAANSHCYFGSDSGVNQKVRIKSAAYCLWIQDWPHWPAPTRKYITKQSRKILGNNKELKAILKELKKLKAL